MKFSIRDLLLVTVVVAVLVAWWMDHRRQAIVIEDSKQLNRIYFHELVDRDTLPIASAPVPNPPKKQISRQRRR